MTTAVSKLPPEVEAIVSEAKALSLSSPAGYSAAGALLIRIRRTVKAIEAALADKLAPYKERIKDLRAEADVHLTVLENADKTLSAGLLAYDQREREAAAAKNAKSMDKWEQKCVTAEAEELPLPPPPAIAAPAIAQIKTVEGSLHYSNITTWNIPPHISQGKPVGAPDLSRANPDLRNIPDDYWTLDTAKITRVVKAGGSVAGVTVKKIKTTMVR